MLATTTSVYLSRSPALEKIVHWTMPGRFKLIFIVQFVLMLFVCSPPLSSQTRPPVPPPTPPQNPSSNADKSDDKPRDLGPMELEMLKRREIKLAEKEHKDNVERAREVAALGAQLRDSYKENKSLGHEGTKKLDRLEKLTRKIRSEAGGSDEDALIDNLPRELEPALSRLAEESDSLQKVVEKTPRQVVSAAVIEKANVLLQLLKFCRGLIR